MQTRLFVATALIFFAACGQVARIQTETSMPSAIPALHIRSNDTSVFDLKITKLDIDVKVIGNIATTTFDITFYNGLDRDLEGEFDFPLADGQSISRYALDINGVLREGVVVEKQKARIAFETTVNRKIDPGLVEKTKGNSFRTRIYPIPANGSKRVVIAIEEALSLTEEGYRYALPLSTAEPVDHFKVAASVINCESKPVTKGNELPGFDFEKDVDTYEGSIEKFNFRPSHLLSFLIPVPASGYSLFAETYSGKTYFYVNTLVAADKKPRKKPASIGVLWDVSSSAEKRNKEKDLELLKKYLGDNSGTKLIEIPFDISTHPQKLHDNASSIIKSLSDLPIDGGTQLGAIDLRKYDVEEILLFTDGISSFGKKEMSLGNMPVIIINSSQEADHSYLKFVAAKTNGRYIDLSKTSVDDALTALQTEPLQLIQVKVKDGEVEEIVSSGEVKQGGFGFAGILKSKKAVVELGFGYGKDVAQTKKIEILAPFENDYDNIKRIWASMKIDDLNIQYEKNKDQITALGKEHSIVTQNTSLIVLDRVEDYVEHKIVPPAELRKEYAALIAQAQNEEVNQKEIAINGALEAMEELKQWYGQKIDTSRKNTTSVDDRVFNSVQIAAAPPQVSASPDANVSRSQEGEAKLEEVVVVRGVNSFANVGNDGDGVAVAYDSAVVFGFSSGLTYRYSTSTVVSDDRASSVEVKAWKPDVAYLKKMEKTPEKEWTSTYFELKEKYKMQPSFYFDMSRFFYEKKMNALALRVLSNIAELRLADLELLRIMAYQLLESGEKETAIETFREILELREEHPQSHRDLALAYAENGEYQQSLDLLYSMLERSWDDRFQSISSIAIMELNALIGSHKSLLNLEKIDKRFIYPMPVDVRIIIGWSADNSDVDLWVTEPKGEKCDYSHNRTAIGGRMSQDITQGFGPEEYLLKRAPNGKFKIEVNLYGDTRQSISGPITIKADLYTDYGRPNQKKRTINFRVENHKDVVEIGALEFGKK